MTPKFRFEMVVIWDACRVRQLNLLQHHVSRSPTSWWNEYEGWIRVNQWISQFCHVQRRSLLSEYNSENGAFPSNQLDFFSKLPVLQPCLVTVWNSHLEETCNLPSHHQTGFKHLHEDVRRLQIWARSFKRHRWKWNQDMTSWLFWSFIPWPGFLRISSPRISIF